MEKKISRGSEETFLIKTYKWPTAAKKKKKRKETQVNKLDFAQGNWGRILAKELI